MPITLIALMALMVRITLLALIALIALIVQAPIISIAKSFKMAAVPIAI